MGLGFKLSLLGGAAALVLLAMVVVPSLLRLAFGLRSVRPNDLRQRVVLRYAKLGTHAWMFAWFKTRLDPMFNELPKIAQTIGPVKTILDLGCGLGVAGSFLLESIPEARIYGVDPLPNRVRVANRAFAERGQAFVGAAPDFEVPGLPDRVDAVVCLDVSHFLDEAKFTKTLERIRARLNDDGWFVLRAVIPPKDNGSWLWKVDRFDRKLKKIPGHHRPVDEVRTALAKGGFDVQSSKESGGNAEMVWFISRPASARS